jgi:hypothetical protein
MSNQDLNRRDFDRLAAAALGGLVAGAAASASAYGADEAPKKDPKKNPILGS